MGEMSTGKSDGGSADSYIGSLISLTSKFEIQYEGILYNINTEESSIGLRNVRSFGTEGRKKDGPQILPSDKIYEYILFRGTNIKDLQVKSSPPVQTLPSIHNDPAVIQSHYSHSASLSANMGSGGSSSVADAPHRAPEHIPQPILESRLPMYEPGGAVGSLGSNTTLPPNASSTGLTMPTYREAYYGSLGGHPQIQQQAFPFRPPPGLSIPQTMPQQLSYPGLNASLRTIPQTLPQQLAYPGLNASSQTGSTTLPKISNYVQPTSNSVSSTSLQLPSVIMPNHIATLPSESSQNLISDKAPLLSLSLAGSSTSLPLTSSFISSSQEISALVTPFPTKGKPLPVSTLPYQTLSQSVSSIMGTSPPVHTETLIAPNQLQSMRTGHRDVDVVVPSSSTHSSDLVSSDVKTSVALLPKPSDQKGSRAVTQFTEEFDFMAMNEKFKKDEVWGHLGKVQMQRDKLVHLEEDNGDCLPDNNDHADRSGIDNKPVYVKDDFFDSISCNALQQGSWNGRTRFSEQRKLDTETFGDFSRYRDGRGAGRRGTFRGSYYGGRGYGYGGRGRGNMTFSHDL